MASSVRLRCDDPVVAGPIRAWLDGTELVAPVPVELRLQVVPSIVPFADPRAPFPQPSVEIRTGPPIDDVRVSWLTEPARAVIPPGALAAEVELTPAAAARLDACIPTFLLVVVILLLRRAGWHHVHGATAIDPEGRGWLIAGNARAGKSTTTALLATRRWAVGTDDTAFLTAAGGRVAVVGCRAPIALRDGGYDLLRLETGTPLARRRKTGCWPEELGATWVSRVEPDRVLFTEVGRDHTTAVSLAPRETLTRLIRWSGWVVLEPELAQEHLDLLTGLARQARGYDVTLGRDLFDHPERLLELAG